MNRIIVSCTLALAFVLGSVATAQAAKPSCTADIARFCKGVKSGGGRVKACLDSHLDELSDRCRALRGDPPREGARVVASCDADIKKHCKGVKAGGGRIKACLDNHVDELTEGCKKLRGDQQVYVNAFKAACQADIDKHCPNVEPGKGRRLACLDNRWSLVSEGCRSVIDEEVEQRMIAAGPCASDIQKVCKETVPGDGRVRQCLKDHGKDLNPACRDRIGAPNR